MYWALTKCLHRLLPTLFGMLHSSMAFLFYFRYEATSECPKTSRHHCFPQNLPRFISVYYATKLKIFNLESQEYRWYNFDLILYKIMSDFSDNPLSKIFQFAPPRSRHACQFQLSKRYCSINNVLQYKLQYKRYCSINVHIWNLFPADIITAPTPSAFKLQLSRLSFYSPRL